MKYIRYDKLNNPFKVYKKDGEVKDNNIGHAFINEEVYRRKVKVVAIFESLQEFKGFVSYLRNEIIKSAKPCGDNYYFLKMRKYYPESEEDYGLYVFDNVEAAADVRDYLLNGTNTFKDADIRIVDKDDNEIELEGETEKE